MSRRPRNVQGLAQTSQGRPLAEVHSEHDRVGVQDFVLLEDYKSEAAFMTNLRDRFRSHLIYVCHGVTLML